MTGMTEYHVIDDGLRSNLPCDQSVLILECMSFGLCTLDSRGMARANGLYASIEELITSYHELNPVIVEELTEAPSPLEFMRYVSRSTPFVVRGGATHWPAMSWTTKHLEELMGDTLVEVAMTPSG